MPEVGSFVELRGRRWLVEAVEQDFIVGLDLDQRRKLALRGGTTEDVGGITGRRIPFSHCDNENGL